MNDANACYQSMEWAIHRPPSRVPSPGTAVLRVGVEWSVLQGSLTCRRRVSMTSACSENRK